MPHQTQDSSTRHGGSKVFVWDIPVRLFHWSLVALVVALMITGKFLDGAIELHATLGRIVLALILFRLVWGVVGSSYARFTQFVRGLRVVFTYARSLLTGQSQFITGHNPLGGWMVLILLAVISTQSILGLFANDDILFEGPLAYLVSKETSDFITGLHSSLFDGLLVLVALHVAAVIWHKLFKNENLLKAMFTGYKELPLVVEAEDAKGGGTILAILLFVISIIIVYGLSQ